MNPEKSLLDEYAIEASDLLDEAEDALLKIDKNPDIKKIYDMVFRSFHSLKGSSGMIGYDKLQRHLHLLEDFLQKSKNNFEHFKSSADYYLSGIDAARKILNGESVDFAYEVYSDKNNKKIDVSTLKSKKILYLSNSKIKPLGESILGLEKDLDFLLRFLSTEDLGTDNLKNQDYDVLVSDLKIEFFKQLIPQNKLKYPVVLIVDEVDSAEQSQNVFQILKKGDEKLRIFLTIQNALISRKNIELFDKAKGILMYMYSDLDEYLIEKKKLDTQKVLSTEIREFIKDFSR